MTNSQRLRFAVISSGSMGRAHMNGIKRSLHADLAAICDPRPEAIQEAGKQFGLSAEDCYLDHQYLIRRDDIDVVVVSSPDSFHEEQTVQALEAGKHVLCEKPMALTVGECRRMVQAADRNHRKLMVGQVCRYAPGFVLAKKMVERGEIGDLFMVESEYAHDYTYHPGVGNWRKDPARPREPVLGGGCHAVDLLRWIAGDPYEVTAYANHKVLIDWPVNDCTVGILRFPNDVIGKVMVSIGCKRTYTMRSVFYGTKGTIIADNQLNHIVLYRDNIQPDDTKLFENRYPEVLDQWTGLFVPVNVESHNVAAEVNELSEAILADRPVLTDGRQGAATIAACCALIESAAIRTSVMVDYSF